MGVEGTGAKEHEGIAIGLRRAFWNIRCSLSLFYFAFRQVCRGAGVLLFRLPANRWQRGIIHMEWLAYVRCKFKECLRGGTKKSGTAQERGGYFIAQLYGLENRFAKRVYRIVFGGCGWNSHGRSWKPLRFCFRSGDRPCHLEACSVAITLAAERLVRSLGVED